MIRDSRMCVTDGQRSVPRRDRYCYGAGPTRFIHRAVDNFIISQAISRFVALWCRVEGGQVESNERYYRRRAVEERMAAQRAVTETARAWHAKLAEDFAARAVITNTVVA